MANIKVHIILGANFNCKIILNHDLEFVIFGNLFNISIVLTKKLIFVTFGYYFDKDLILPKSTLQLTLENNFSCSICFPKYVIYLRFTYSSNVIHSLTKKIKYLEIGVTQKFLSMPKNAIKIFFKDCCEQLVQLPKYLKCLHIPNNLHYNIKLTPKLVHLSMGLNTRICIGNIPCQIHIKFINGYYLSHNLSDYYMYENLPNSVKTMSIEGGGVSKRIFNNLPNTIGTHENIELLPKVCVYDFTKRIVCNVKKHSSNIH